MTKPNDTTEVADASTKAEKGDRGRNKAFKAAVEATPPARHFDVASREYDIPLIEEFLDTVFHSDFTENEEVLAWSVSRHGKPVYPMAEHDLLDSLNGSKVAKALYFGTATAHRDANTGGLYNRQSLFERLHVIVLDDIGTKAPASGLAEAMQDPTYILETSPGNFQYGYVLDTPISDMASARALVTLMYEAGIADAGGKMPNKLVRLPEGINGKKDRDKCDFVTRLVTMEGPRWTPQALLDALDTGATWAEIETSALEATKRRARMLGGTTPWAPFVPARASMSGIIDPVAEWLAEREEIISENGDWLTIKCPFAQNHTSGGETAGYKQLGMGEDPAQRAFHCFHDGCSDMKTREFLNYVALLDGPSVSAKDEVANLVATYVYDSINDCAWKIKNTDAPKALTMSGMRNTHPRKTMVPGPEGKLTPVSEYARWLTSESRVVVMGPTFDPSNPSRLIERQGDLYVNQYAPPSWGEGPYDAEQVKKFTDFLKYLIPDGFERGYFTDWLAAKCQDMGFRGAAIVMVAQRQGIGRSTLSTMIETLLGEVNVRNEPFEKIVGEVQYNDWLESPFIVSDETLNTGGLNSYRTYEKLKEMIDPRPRLMSINPKYGKQRRTMVHSSFLFLSNHSNAMAMSEDDRRFFVISNPHVPAPPAYFTKLNEWMNTCGNDDRPEWARHVYRYLMAREMNMETLLSPPPSTTAKRAMMEESRSDIDNVAQEILNFWPCEYISSSQFTSAIETFAQRLDLYDMPNYKAQLKRIFAMTTYPLDQTATIKIDGKTARLRVIITKAEPGTTASKGESLGYNIKKVIRAALSAEKIQAGVSGAAEALDVKGI
jgi:hypothetical protein